MYRINELLKLNQKLLHTDDLAVLWKIDNKNSLYTQIKRDVKKGVLIPVFKGLYSTIPLSLVDKYLLGVAAIHKYCYVSTETILWEKGILLQKTYKITFASSVSRSFNLGENSYLVRKMDDKYLLQGTGVYEKDGVFYANTERAVADLLYFDPNYYFDASSLIDWKKVKEIKKEVGYV